MVLLDGSVKFDPCEILEVPEKVLSYYPKIENTKEKDRLKTVLLRKCYVIVALRKMSCMSIS